MKTEVYNNTIEEVKTMLGKEDRCMLIRPTGFGKTQLLAELTHEYARTLYLYPLEIIKIDIESRGVLKENTQFMTYSKLRQLNKVGKLKELTGFDLVILDEVHVAGATLTRLAVEKLMEQEAKFIGATATPDRSDGYDVTQALFDGNIISDYSLGDAMDDGIIQKPHYVYSVYQTAGVTDGIRKSVNNLNDEVKKKEILEKIKAIEVEMGNILNAPNVVKESVDKVYPNGTKYMKFIVFFSEKKSLDMRKDEVEKWFKVAFPDMRTRGTIVTSDAEYSGNVQEINKLEHEEAVIDLVFCIDMLNMGYHIADLTGIVMLRGTQSSIIYKQQIGRCLSVATDKTPIVFDFVNNIFRKPYFGAGGGYRERCIDSSGGRFRDIDIKDFEIDDRIASYAQFLERVTYEIGQLSIDEAVNFYINRSMPMETLTRFTKLRESYIRSEFAKRGIEVEDVSL